MKASVIIPAKNPGAIFHRVLDHILAQEAPWPFEVIVIDSGSADGTVEYARSKPGVTVIGIPPQAFAHGRTRNLGISRGCGEFMVLVTADALPTDNRWLTNLVGAVEQHPSIAGAFGRHIAYPHASPFTKRDIEDHFAGFVGYPQIVNQYTDRQRYASDVGWRQFLHFYSDNNSCLRRSVWERIPYPDVDFAEDQIWAQQVIAAGWSRAYAQDAVVYHSHDYTVIDSLRRAFDESATFRRFFGYRLGGSTQGSVRSIIGLSVSDLAWARQNGISALEMRKRILHNAARVIGHSLGARADSLPRWLQARLSQWRLRHGKSRTSGWHSWLKARTAREPNKRRVWADYRIISKSGLFDSAYYLTSNSDLLAGDIDPVLHYVIFGANEGRNPSRTFSTRWYMESHPDLTAWKRNPLVHFILHGAKEGRQGRPSDMIPNQSGGPGGRPFEHLHDSIELPEVALAKPNRAPKWQSLDIHWVISDFAPGDGGHMSIFRIAKLLAQFGHRQTLWIQNPSHNTPAHARQTMEQHFVTADAELRFLPSDVSAIAGDVVIATDCWTAFPVAAMPNFFRRFYFVQDYETYFYPAGSQALLADYTYSLGFDCLCAGEWLSRLMGQHELWTMIWNYAADKVIYFPPPDEGQRFQNRIAYYSRMTTPGRAVELGLVALEELARWGYQFTVDFFGGPPASRNVSYPYQDRGILSPMEMANLYREDSIGMVFSATNCSFVSWEMMACALPVVELDVDSVRSSFPDKVLIRATPHPIAIAERLASLLDDNAKRAELAKRGYTFQSQFSWEKSARQIESAFFDRLFAATMGSLDDTIQYQGPPYRVRQPLAP